MLQRLEFHYTPKHASWLNMVEIEIGVLRGQCLDRRIGERNVLVSEIKAGSSNATRPARASNGSSPRKRRETSWHALIPTPPKSHNHCAEALVPTSASQHLGGRLSPPVTAEHASCGRPYDDNGSSEPSD